MLFVVRIACKIDLQVQHKYAAHFNVKSGSEFTDHCALEGCESNNVRYTAVQIKQAYEIIPTESSVIAVCYQTLSVPLLNAVMHRYKRELVGYHCANGGGRGC